MRVSRTGAAITLSVAALALASCADAAHGHQGSASQRPQTSPAPFTVMATGCPTGQPAGQPHLPLRTVEDVCAWLQQGVSFGKIGVSGAPVIAEIVYTTPRGLDQATNDSEMEANYPADLPIWYVAYRGVFTVSAPPGVSSPPRDSAFIIIHAQTGDQFMMGTPAHFAQ